MNPEQGKSNSSKTLAITPPTRPVAPKIAIFITKIIVDLHKITTFMA
jgi:hypothetical protein